jgi:predicted Zn-dependent protease
MKTVTKVLLSFAALALAWPLRAGFGLGDLDLNKAVNTVKHGSKILKGAVGIGPEEERAIGESVALEIIGKYGGLVRDEEITKRVNLVGRSLAYYSSRPALDWRFAVLNSNTVNGFSAPGGLVFITRGLYDLAGADDNALAAVLAHEISHITGRHALKIVSRGEFVSGTADLLSERSGDVAAVQSQLSQFDVGIGQLVTKILETGFDPETEFAADKAGHDLASTVGFAPGGLRGVLVRLQAKTEEPKAVFSTHPPLADRIKRLPDEPTS